MHLLLSRLETLFWEAALGIRTRGNVEVHVPGAVLYSPLSYTAIREVLRGLRPQADDVLLDVGSGKGRVACCALRWYPCSVWGVDVDERLTEVALQNVARCDPSGRRSRVVCQPAQDFNYEMVSVIVMYNPFDASVFRPVLDRIAATATRVIRLAYANPLHDQLLHECSWAFHERTTARSPWAHPVSFWRLDPVAARK